MTAAFITGVNGFIGSHLAKDLVRRGYRVVGATSRPAGLDVMTPGIARKVVLPLGTACDAGTLHDVDVVVHCAWDLRRGAAQANVDGTTQLVDVAQAAGVSYQLFVSSYSAHPTAIGEYGKAKFTVQEYCRRRGLGAVRPGLVIGRGGLYLRMSDVVARHIVVPLVDGGRDRVPIIAIGDLVDALGAIIERRLPGVFTLFNPERTTLRDLMAEIRSSVPRRGLFVSVPSRLLMRVARTLGSLGIASPVSEDTICGLRANRDVRDASDLPTFVARPRTLAEMVRAAGRRAA